MRRRHGTAAQGSGEYPEADFAAMCSRGGEFQLGFRKFEFLLM
jgi:hypothetical protein